ncbi:MAG: hypothetical protein PF569_01565 [Candidatus Woesearchaeota archaeon]|nr:hypothetical protein [Candidatus Woesearchaeota archaeon]
MDKLTLIIETSAVGLALIVFGIILLAWSDFSEAINLAGQSRFVIGILCLMLGVLILVINRFESASLRE